MVDYFNSNKLSYSYKIDGLFDNFQKIEGNIIEISGLPYGKYKLIVRGQSADKIYSQQQLEIPLIVIRPFFLRWWFILLTIVLLFVSILQIYYWRIRQLEERKEQLEILVNQRTKQIQLDKEVIEGQAEQLKELDQLKSRFFANISHELRTPLTLILAPLNGVLKRKNYDNKDFTALQLMQQNGKKLLKRINELLDLSRLDANKLEVNETPTFLYPFLKTILSTFESAANIKKVDLLFDYDLNEQMQILLDTDKLEKIISNYLSNALKFTPKEGKIKLKARKDGNQLHLSVSDTGIGILPEELGKVFDRFYQTSQTQKNIGSGIGLSLCKELSKVLNGKVWATSEIGSGSVFHVQIPLVETFATKENTQTFEPTTEESLVILPSDEAISSVQANDNRPTLLIVEDNPDLRQYISLILSKDYNVITAENGQEGVERLTKNDRSLSTVRRLPSLIISDIIMPIMDGMELLKTVKADDNLCNIPMIMLTARQDTEVKLEALRIGVDDYLTKPFKEEELLVRIENLINNSKNRVTETTEEEAEKAISAADMAWLTEVETIIVNHISNPKFKLSKVAEMMNISYRRLQQKLKAITGLSPKQYQRSIKFAKV